MRAAGRGRIVNISSIGGLFSVGLGGWYHATKYALEALSDALRQEVAGFGIDVVLVEPGLIKTPWATIASDNLRQISGHGAYAAMANSYADSTEFAGSYATDAAKLGQLIATAATTRCPRTRYRKGSGSFMIPRAKRWLPTWLFDRMALLVLTRSGDLVEWLRGRIGQAEGDG
jgi:NAD(P)-dependent dehydrogenase (short-subunit alcohol dehydrogenase family)